YIAVLTRQGLFDGVLERVSPTTRAMLLEPPPASSWVDATVTEEVALAVAALAGPEAWRRVVLDATRTSVIPILRLALARFIRLFGATPASIFSRLGQLTANIVRGIEYEYTPTSPRSGDLVIRQLGRRDTPLVIFQGAAGGFSVVFELCRTKGAVSEPELIPD